MLFGVTFVQLAYLWENYGMHVARSVKHSLLAWGCGGVAQSSWTPFFLRSTIDVPI
jgi:hypothetical protein